MQAVTTTPITPSSAARELLRRRQARARLIDFTTYTKPDYLVSWHHDLTASYIDRWVARDIRRLIICEPPRYGKSELTSRRAPAFILGRNPNARIIAATYSSDFASLINRDVQRIIDDPAYQALFPNTRLNTKNVRSDAHGSYLRNSEIFEIVGYRGTYRSVGRGGAATGTGADYIIIDDPIKNKEEAHSPAVRAETYGWYNTVIRTRAEKDACIMIIVTRWHLADLVGALLEDSKHPDADKWHVLVLPARANNAAVREAYGNEVADNALMYDRREQGALLWPEKYDDRADKALQVALGPEDYPALFGQTPLPTGGRKFQREWFKLVPAVPLQSIRVRYWDKAGTQDAGAYTCGVLMAFPLDGSGFYIEDVERFQLASGPRNARIKQVAQLDQRKYGNLYLGDDISPYTVWVEQEPGSGGKESAENTILDLAGINVYAERATGDKVLRAGPLAAQAYAGNVYVLDAPWAAELINEFANFPVGTFKDQVDSASGAFNKLALGWDTEAFDIYEDRVSISPY